MSDTIQTTLPQTAPTGQTAAIVNTEQQGTLDMWNDPAAMNLAKRNAVTLSNSGLVPQNYQGKPENCLIALDMANRMGVSPLFVMQNLYVVKGKPSWSGQSCMSLIKMNGEFTDVEPVYFGEKGTDGRGCYIKAVNVKSGKTVTGTEVTLGMAKAEGWTSNPKWRNMPDLMLGYRAAAFFARIYCPNALMGVQTAEEVEDTNGQQSRHASPDVLGGAR